jgi:hypothetical protein
MPARLTQLMTIYQARHTKIESHLNPKTAQLEGHIANAGTHTI